MIKQIATGIWKFIGISNVYYLESEKTIIDTGTRTDASNLKLFLGKVIDFGSVSTVVFTHLHYDHIGNFDLFPSVKFYASKEEIEDFKKDPRGTVLDLDIANKFDVELTPIGELKTSLEIIPTPGHTRGSICLWHPGKKILFSGDTIFRAGYGRLDLPTSVPAKMQGSINKLVEYNYKILCPGHDY